MSLSNDTGGGGGKIITVVGGKWTLRVPEETEGAAKRTNKAGNEVWEKQFSKVDGFLYSCAFLDGEFGQTVNLTLYDEKENQHYVVGFGITDRLLMDFIKMLPNISPDHRVALCLAPDKEKKTKSGKPVTNLFIRQGPNVCKWAYTKDHPDGMPKGEQTRTGWDFRKQEDWLLDKLEVYFKDFMPQVTVSDPDADEEGYQNSLETISPVPEGAEPASAASPLETVEPGLSAGVGDNEEIPF